MTLSELRTMVRDLIFDKAPTADPFDVAGLNRFVNAALHEVWTIARALQRSLFITNQSVTVLGANALTATVTLTAPYTRVKRIILVWKTDAVAGPLAVKRFATGGLEITGMAQSRPAVTLTNESIVILDPPTSLAMHVWYVAGLPDMTDDANTPGQTGNPNTGTANFLPLEYHGLVALKAAVMALKAERGEWSGLQADFDEQRMALERALVGQDDTAEDG
jgi:hypothetical protein